MHHLSTCAGSAQASPATHYHTHHPFVLAGYTALEAWEQRAAALRERILFSSGLVPEPPRCPLNARVYDRVEFADFTVEKVVLESLPGLFVTGNLYRPRHSDGAGKRPAILNPHGHWLKGRLEYGREAADYEAADSVQEPVRNANFAKLGYISFSYDMVGFADSRQLPHRYEGDIHTLWGSSLLGLQLWNSIRALDFLCELADADAGRIGCTGASGGATQAILLGAVDRRVKLLAPVNMISAHMQGGCCCENAPNLRIGTNNVELSALFAPRPMLAVGCSGDWTCHLPEVEYPALRQVYELYGAGDQVELFYDKAAPHNYNQQAREAVYNWFRKHFDGVSDHWVEQAVDFGNVMEVLAIHAEPATVELGIEEEAERSLLARQQEGKRAWLGAQYAGLDAGGRERLHRLLAQVFELPGGGRRTAAAGCGGNSGSGSSSSSSSSGSGSSSISGSSGSGSESGSESGSGSRRYALVFGLDCNEDNWDYVDVIEEQNKTPYSEIVPCLLPGTGSAVHPYGAAAQQAYRAIKYDSTFNVSLPVQAVRYIVAAIQEARTLQPGTIDVYGVGEASLAVLAALPFVSPVQNVILHMEPFSYQQDNDYVQRFFVPHFRAAGGFESSLLLAEAERIAFKPYEARR